MRAARLNVGVFAGVIYRILLCAGCVWLARALWPESPQWWALGLYAILFYVAAFILGVVAIRITSEEAIRLVRVRRFGGNTRAPRADKLAGDDELDHAGLL